MKPTPIFISHLGLKHIQKQKNSKRVGYIHSSLENMYAFPKISGVENLSLWRGGAS